MPPPPYLNAPPPPPPLPRYLEFNLLYDRGVKFGLDGSRCAVAGGGGGAHNRQGCVAALSTCCAQLTGARTPHAHSPCAPALPPAAAAGWSRSWCPHRRSSPGGTTCSQRRAARRRRWSTCCARRGTGRDRQHRPLHRLLVFSHTPFALHSRSLLPLQFPLLSRHCCALID